MERGQWSEKRTGVKRGQGAEKEGSGMERA